MSEDKVFRKVEIRATMLFETWGPENDTAKEIFGHWVESPHLSSQDLRHAVHNGEYELEIVGERIETL